MMKGSSIYVRSGFLVVISLLVLTSAIIPGCTVLSSAEQFYDQGINFNDHNQYEQALESFNKSLELNPRLAKTWVAKAITLYNMKRFDAALESVENALALEPGSADALRVKEEILSAMAKTGETDSRNLTSENGMNTSSATEKRSISNLYIIPAGTFSLFRE